MRQKHKPVEYEPEVLAREDAHGKVYTHSAYGQIAVFRTTGHSTMYGSEFNHQNFVSIELHESERHRNLARDWHHQGKLLARLRMSEAQWATFVSAVGQGSGVCCTLEYADGTRRGNVPPPKTVEMYKGEGKEAIQGAVDELDALSARIKELTEKLPKKTADLLMYSVITAKAKLVSTLPFIAESFAEHMEDTIEFAKIEIEATVSQALHRAGMEALALQQPLTLALPEPEGQNRESYDDDQDRESYLTGDDPCPNCGAPLVNGDGGSGVKCTKCLYRFCY